MGDGRVVRPFRGRRAHLVPCKPETRDSSHRRWHRPVGRRGRHVDPRGHTRSRDSARGGGHLLGHRRPGRSLRRRQPPLDRRRAHVATSRDPTRKGASMKRIALLGAGAIAEVHLEAARQIPGAAITWVVDIDRAKADRLAAKAGARSTSDPAEAVGSEDTDAVIVAVPTPSHRAMVELAASFGKDILCEKPLARTRDDADAIVAACDATGVRLMTGQVVRFFPEYQRIHAALQENAIGKPGLVRASRVGPSPGPGRAWFNDSAASGGVALDMMVHEFDLLRWWFGDASRIYASGLAAAQPDADYAQAVVRFASGVIAHVEASWAHAAFRTTIEVAG